MEISTLKRQARESAKWRGHKLGNFRAVEMDCFLAVCKECGAQVVVNTKPRANDIDIMGNAVAIGCGDLL